MYGETADKTKTQPSRLKKILMAVLLMAIGSGVTGVAMGYYYTGQCNEQYRFGKIDGAEECRKQVQAQQQDYIHKLDSRLSKTN